MSEEDKLGILAGVTFVLSPEQYTKYKKSLNEQINNLQKQLDKQKEVLDKIKEYVKKELSQGGPSELKDLVNGDYILELLEEIE